MKILGIDIGGSALKGAPVDTVSGKLLAERRRIATPEVLSPPQMAKAVAELVAHFNWKGPVGVGFPGVVQYNVIRTSANLDKDFIDCDAGKLFGKATGLPFTVINDADAAGMAEIKFGAAKGHRGSVLLLTLGTGVGSALFYDGRLVPNTEFGHIPLRGKSAEKRVASSVKDRKELSWKEWGYRLNEYLCLVEALVWPELIILGGGVSEDHEKFFKFLKTRTPIVAAALRNEAGIVGAALGAEQK